MYVQSFFKWKIVILGQKSGFCTEIDYPRFQTQAI